MQASRSPRWWRALAFALLVLPGCIGTPAPDPPDLREVEVSIPPAAPGSIGFDVLGGPGAVAPGATVWAAGFFADDPPATVVADSAGAFQLTVIGHSGRPALRLEVRQGDARSAPVDLLGATGRNPAARLPRTACVGLEETFELRGAGSVVAVLANDCAEPVTVLTAAPRRAGLSVAGGVFPQEVAAGTSLTLELTYDGAAAFDDLVIVDLRFPGRVDPEPRAIGVRATP